MVEEILSTHVLVEVPLPEGDVAGDLVGEKGSNI